MNSNSTPAKRVPIQSGMLVMIIGGANTENIGKTGIVKRFVRWGELASNGSRASFDGWIVLGDSLITKSVSTKLVQDTGFALCREQHLIPILPPEEEQQTSTQQVTQTGETV